MKGQKRSPEVRARADAELASRSLQGLWGNPTVAILAGLTTTLVREHPSVSSAFAAFTVAVAVSRAYLLFGWKKPRRICNSCWRRLLIFNVVLSAAGWGAIGAFILSHYSMGQPNVTFMMLFSASIAGAGVHLMVEKVSLAVTYSLAILGPPMVVCLRQGGGSGYFALCLAYYLVYLAGQSRRSTRSFWRGIEDNVELGRLAHHDSLTGLANRLALESRVDAVLRSNRDPDQRICLLYIDLNGFKQVNDRYTHRVGDLLLTEVAARLRAAVNPEAVACRLGGDEFCVLIAGRLTESDAERMAARILAEVRRPAYIENIVLHPSASIGISFHPQAGADLKDLLRTADQAMYLAKAVAGGGIRSADSAPAVYNCTLA